MSTKKENTSMDITNDVYHLRKEELEHLLEMAFMKGEQWGITYQGWFTPSVEYHMERKGTATSGIINYVDEAYAHGVENLTKHNL